MKFFNMDVVEVPINDNSVHLIITSPPYNVGINYDTHADNKPYQEYLDWLTAVFVQLKDKLVDGGRLCINIAPTGVKNFTPIHHDLITNLRKNGYTFVGEILWYKQNIKSRTAWGSFGSPRRPYVLPSWEYVYVLQKGTHLTEHIKSIKTRGAPHAYGKQQPLGRPDITNEEFVKFTDGFWDIKPEHARKGHPVPFPEDLIYRLIKLYSYPGNTVLDPFGGSGTVAAVCAKTGRDSIYVDISENYFRQAQTRIQSIDIVIPVLCPFCKSNHVVKFGRQRGIKQRYRCTDCKKHFDERKEEL